jgi:UDP-glucose 4-epimerase
VVQAFHNSGYAVRTLSLDRPPVGLFPDAVEAITGDITVAPLMEEAVRDVDAVVHLAALLHVVNPPESLRREYQRINVNGTANVVEACLKAGLRRLVFFSTIAVYPYDAKFILSEESLPSPQSYYAESKLAAEKIVLGAKRRDGVPLGTVLRLSAVYGSRIKGNYRRLVHSLANGRFVPLGDGHNRRSLVYDKDVAGAAVLAMRHPAAAGRVYNVSDGQFQTMRQIIEAICVALGRTPPRFALPVGPVRLGAGVLEDAAKIAGRKSPVGRATIDKYTEDVAVSSQRIQTELGFVPQFDLTRGWRETVQEMRQAGDLVRSDV